MFVFRNNTIERFFPGDYSFSGYDDISYIPQEADGYIWFYQAPVRFVQGLMADEIDACLKKFCYVLGKIDSHKTVIAFTMDLLYDLSLVNDDFRVAEALSRYNAGLLSEAKVHKNIKIIDIKEFTRNHPIDELIDWKFYFISQMGLNPRFSNDFKTWFSKKMDQLALKKKKCLILDLDNTLWGGVLGEDGTGGIKIGGDYPGNAFLSFQEALLELSKTGVILTVCSKNNEEDVLEVWKNNPNIVLRKDSFASYRINWRDKASNIRELAEELNLGLDSFVFVDDNPTERELIKQMLPMVCVPDFPAHPYEIPLFFKSLVEKYFKVYSITEEDKKKTEQYKANALRKLSQKEYADYDMFLQSLNLRLTIYMANDFNIQRIAQLTQKTNQFNLTTKRYTDADINAMIANHWKVYCVSVSDRFGDNGISGCLIINGDTIDSFLMSCRVLGKGIETAFMKRVLSGLKNEGYEKVRAKYSPTVKNHQVNDFYEKCGFNCISHNEQNEKEYIANLKDMDLNIKKYYTIDMQ